MGAVTDVKTVLGLAKHGWHVFPVAQGGKRPVVKWSKAATTDPEQIVGWFAGTSHNVGISCGPSGLVVVDEDEPNAFDAFAGSLGETVPATFTVGTGRGRHLYFADPRHEFGNSDRGFHGYPVNVRGQGGYVVGPGSEHASGAVYEAVDDREPVPVPHWLARALRGSQAATEGRDDVFADPDALRTPRGVEAVPEVIRAGDRHNELVGYAGYLRHHGIDLPVAEAMIRMLWERCEQPTDAPMPWDEAAAILHDCYERYDADERYPGLPVTAADQPGEPQPYPFVPGGSFILDTAADPEPMWGCGSEVLWTDGEALMIVGGQGVGKTTLAQQLALGRAGFTEYATLLGHPIRPGAGRTLYLAMDRPRQAARSFRRMVGEAWRAELDERLVVWQGPPPGTSPSTPACWRPCARRPTPTR